MCMQRVKIKSLSPAGIKWCYVPCGFCADCRKKMAQAWQFRLNAEFLTLMRKGWHVAFCTLTYRDSDLPHIPEDCFVNPEDFRSIPCFSRHDVREFIIALRMAFKHAPYDFTGDRRIRYFVASEFGSKKKRPHYHAILAWPDGVSYEQMHAECTRLWTHGMLFPLDYRGDEKCLPFEVIGDASKCFSYISKYVCKDLDFLAQFGNTEFYRSKVDEDDPDFYRYKLWKNCQCFHCQSQSLGFQSIKELSDDDKMKIFREGMSFVADGEIYQIPLYIKNKLVYDPYYVYEPKTGKRVVQRKASAFFLEHAGEIFEKKSEFYQRLCLSSEGVSYFTERGMQEEDAKSICETLAYYRDMASADWPDLLDDNTLGKLYLAYHRVPQHFRYDIAPLSQYMLRYYPDAKLKPDLRPYVERFDCRLKWLDKYWTLVDDANSRLGSVYESARSDEARRIKHIQDYFNSL